MRSRCDSKLRTAQMRLGIGRKWQQFGKVQPIWAAPAVAREAGIGNGPLNWGPQSSLGCHLWFALKTIDFPTSMLGGIYGSRHIKSDARFSVLWCAQGHCPWSYPGDRLPIGFLMTCDTCNVKGDHGRPTHEGAEAVRQGPWELHRARLPSHRVSGPLQLLSPWICICRHPKVHHTC